MTDQIAIHCFISGKVQGVWFRASTKEEATKLGITGFARNLPDGRVEVFACGKREALTMLYEWLKQGPPLAKVDELTYEECAWQAFDRFDTK